MNPIKLFTPYFEANKASRSSGNTSFQRCGRGNIHPKIRSSFQFDLSVCDRFTWFHGHGPKSAFALPACQVAQSWRGQPGGAE